MIIPFGQVVGVFVCFVLFCFVLLLFVLFLLCMLVLERVAMVLCPSESIANHSQTLVRGGADAKKEVLKIFEVLKREVLKRIKPILHFTPVN